jgi:hypothetical protein
MLTDKAVTGRNFELIKLKKKDLKFESEANLYRLPYIELFLSNRKGWQKRLDKGIVEADLRSVLIALPLVS